MVPTPTPNSYARYQIPYNLCRLRDTQCHIPYSLYPMPGTQSLFPVKGLPRVCLACASPAPPEIAVLTIHHHLLLHCQRYLNPLPLSPLLLRPDLSASLRTGRLYVAGGMDLSEFYLPARPPALPRLVDLFKGLCFKRPLLLPLADQFLFYRAPIRHLPPL